MFRILTAGVVLAAALNAAAEPIRNSPHAAPLRTNLTMSAQPLEDISDSFTQRGTGGLIYSAGGNISSGLLTGPVFIADDYQTIAPGPSSQIGLFRFIGGVGDTGQILGFKFFDNVGTPTSPSFTLATSFAVPFPQGGNFIWTFGFTSLSTLTVPNDGVLSFYVVTAGTLFFGQTTSVTVGSNGSYLIPAYDPYTNAPLVTSFQLFAVPDPATLVLLVTGGVVMLGKRAPRTRSARG